MRNIGKLPGSQPVGFQTYLAMAVAVTSLGYTALSEASSEFAIEEIIVTATRREASLQDVSVAVTALPDSILEQALAGFVREEFHAGHGWKEVFGIVLLLFLSGGKNQHVGLGVLR